jgi:hypothetical protein
VGNALEDARGRESRDVALKREVEKGKLMSWKVVL